MADASHHDLPVDSASLRKAAVLLASLPPDEVTYLTNALGEGELERLAIAVAAVNVVDDKEQHALAQELLAMHREARSPVSPVQAETLRQLESANPSIVASALGDELPQTIALVLSQTAAQTAADVLQHLSTDRQLAVVKRMSALQSHCPAAVAVVASEVAASVQARSQPSRNRAGGEAFLAQVVNCTDRATEKALFENLREEDHGLVDRLLQRMHLLRDAQRPQHVEAIDVNSTGRKAG